MLYSQYSRREKISKYKNFYIIIHKSFFDLIFKNLSNYLARRRRAEIFLLLSLTRNYAYGVDTNLDAPQAQTIKFFLFTKSFTTFCQNFQIFEKTMDEVFIV